MKNYYQLLGVSKEAGTDEIRKAFKEAAKKYHPDRNPGDKAAEEKFKEINEAYAVLSDPAKRRDYDSLGSGGFRQRYSQEDIYRGYDFSSVSSIFDDLGLGADLFSQLFGQGGPGPGSQGRRGGGHGGRGGFGGRQPARGPDAEAVLHLTLEDIREGTTKRVTLGNGGVGQELAIKIPSGVESGAKLRLAGKGGSAPGGQPGDLYVTIELLPHPLFARVGLDLETAVDVRLSTLALGGEILVPVLGETQRKLKIPAGSAAGTRLRVRGQGLRSADGAKGDLYVRLNPLLPGSLTPEQKEAFLKLREAGL